MTNLLNTTLHIVDSTNIAFSSKAYNDICLLAIASISNNEDAKIKVLENEYDIANPNDQETITLLYSLISLLDLDEYGSWPIMVQELKDAYNLINAQKSLNDYSISILELTGLFKK